MTFLNPIWLFSLALLAVPIAIHLLSKKEPNIIKIGSVKFLKAAESRQFRTLKFHDILLFLIRSLLVALLCFIIALPESACENSEAKTSWVMIESNLLDAPQPESFYSRLDSLAKNGYELRLLEPGFREISMRDSTRNLPIDFWSLLAEADKRCRSESPIVVFTSARVSMLNGSRPSLWHQFEMFFITITESKKWIERVAPFSNDSLFISVGFSDSTQTVFSNYFAPVPDSEFLADPLRLKRQGDSVLVQLLDAPSETTFFSLEAKKIWLIAFDDSSKVSLPYLEKALNALASFSPEKVVVTSMTVADAPKAQAEWLIWLSNAEPPPRQNLIRAVHFTREMFFSDRILNELSAQLLPKPSIHYDLRRAAIATLLPKKKELNLASESRKHSLIFPLWIFAILLFALERWLTNLKK